MSHQRGDPLRAARLATHTRLTSIQPPYASDSNSSHEQNASSRETVQILYLVSSHSVLMRARLRPTPSEQWCGAAG